MEKDVSVVIPLFDSEKTISRVLDSVREQTVFERIKEIVIVNDGSTDDSLNVVHDYINRFHLSCIKVISQDNSGVSHARNVGISNSSGKYIALLDSDDVWLPKKLEKQLEILDSNENISFLGCGHENKPFRMKIRKRNKLYKASISDILWKYFPVTPSVIFRRSCIEKVGLFDEDQKYCEDINYFLRFAVFYNYYYLPTKLVTIGIGKSFNTESGLSSNIKGMHEGEMKNIRDLKSYGAINVLQYAGFYIFLEIKYIRRRIMKLFRK